MSPKKAVAVADAKTEAKKPVEGKQIIAAVIDMARNQTGGHCHGVFYWAPEADRGYELGAFQHNRPTIIMEAFTEAAQKE